MFPGEIRIRAAKEFFRTHTIKDDEHNAQEPGLLLWRQGKDRQTRYRKIKKENPKDFLEHRLWSFLRLSPGQLDLLVQPPAAHLPAIYYG